MFPKLRATEVCLGFTGHLPLHITQKRWRGRGGKGGATNKIDDQYFFFEVLWKVDLSRKRHVKESHFKCISQKTQDEQPFWNVEKARWKETLKINTPLRFSNQYNQEGRSKPAEEFPHKLMTENEGKNEIIEVNCVLNIHHTVYGKMAFLNRDWSKFIP